MSSYTMDRKSVIGARMFFVMFLSYFEVFLWMFIANNYSTRSCWIWDTRHLIFRYLPFHILRALLKCIEVLHGHLHWGYEFYLLVLSISHSFATLTRERYYPHEKIKFVSPRSHVMFCLFYRYWWNFQVKHNFFIHFWNVLLAYHLRNHDDISNFTVKRWKYRIFTASQRSLGVLVS